MRLYNKLWLVPKFEENSPIGAWVAYIYASVYLERVRRFAFIKYVLPGFGVWEAGITSSPKWTNDSDL